MPEADAQRQRITIRCSTLLEGIILHFASLCRHKDFLKFFGRSVGNVTNDLRAGRFNDFCHLIQNINCFRLDVYLVPIHRYTIPKSGVYCQFSFAEPRIKKKIKRRIIY